MHTPLWIRMGCDPAAEGSSPPPPSRMARPWREAEGSLPAAQPVSAADLAPDHLRPLCACSATGRGQHSPRSLRGPWGEGAAGAMSRRRLLESLGTRGHQVPSPAGPTHLGAPGMPLPRETTHPLRRPQPLPESDAACRSRGRPSALPGRCSVLSICHQHPASRLPAALPAPACPAHKSQAPGSYLDSPSKGHGQDADSESGPRGSFVPQEAVPRPLPTAGPPPTTASASLSL